MMTQSGHEYDPSKYVKSRSMTGPLPANYVCYRCGLSGHWIKSCPTNNIEIKRSTGIPRSFMVTVDGPEIKGALLTSSGDFAVPLIDQLAYKTIKKEKPPFLKEAEVPPEPEPQLPEDLLCMFCKDLLQDAVLIPCCGNSFCDECVRQALLDSENHECPVCHETDISPDTLIPNRFQRNAVRNFKNETGYIGRTKKGALPEPVPEAPAKRSPRPEALSGLPDELHDETLVAGGSSVQLPITAAEVDPETLASETVISEDLESKLETGHDEKADAADPETRAATPLADEPVVEFKDTFEASPHHRNRSYEGKSRSRYDYRSPPPDSSEPLTISTITTRVAGAPIRKTYWNKYNSQYESYSHRDYRDRDYSSNYRSSSSEYSQRPFNRNYSGGSYRYSPRGSSRGSRYSRYSSPPPHSSSRYSSPPPAAQSHRSSHLPPPVNIHHPPPTTVVHAEHPSYHTEPSPPGTDSHSHPPPTRPEPHHEPLPTHTEPPPPHREPLLPEPTTHHEPPPPGVGPILPLPPPAPTPVPPSLPVLAQPPPTTTVPTSTAPTGPTYHDNYSRHLEVYRQSNAYHSRRNKDKKWSKDPMDDFARELMEFDRERRTNPSRRSRSRSYHSSKSWSRSRSRSYSPSRSRSRSRSHTYSSRSRSRSFSRSRSRSRTLIRSFSRSRSHSRSSINSVSRSPRRKYRPSPHRYYRSRTRTPPPPRHYKEPPTKPYHKRPELHSPSYYSQTTFVPTYPANLPPNTSHAEPYPPDRGYYDHYHMGYEGGYSSHRENRRFDINVPPPEGRYPPHMDKFVDPRKYFSRGQDRRVIPRKDDRSMGRADAAGGYVTEKYKDRPADLPPYPGRKDEKAKEERSSHHHKHRDSKKPHEAVKKTKEVKVKSEGTTDTAQSAVAKEAKSKKTSKGEKHVKEHKHKHKKVKDGEEHKKKKKQKSSDETSQVTGSESDKPKKMKKKKKGVVKMKQIVEVPEKTEAVEVKEEPLENQSIVGDVEEEEETVVAADEPEAVVKCEKVVESESPEPNEGEQTPSLECEERTEKVEVEEEVNAEKEEDPSSELDPVAEPEFTEVKDEVFTQNESFSGEELPAGSGDESDVADGSANDSVLKVSLPEISKWERDDSEEAESDEEPSSPLKEKGDVEEASKLPLTSDILQKAENAILQKAPKLQSSGEGQGTLDKSSDHSDSSPEHKGSETPESKHDEVVETRTKVEKKEVTVRKTGSESPRKKDDSRVISLRKEVERKEWEHSRRDKSSFETRTVRLGSYRSEAEGRDGRIGLRDWERDRPGSRNSSGSLHSSESRRRSSSRGHSIHERHRERQRYDSRREVIVRPPLRSTSSRTASEVVSRRREPVSESTGTTDSKSTRQRKPSRDHHHDESHFEPNYDGTSDSDASNASDTEQKVTKRRVSIKNEPLPSKHSRSSKSSHADSSTSKQDKKLSVKTSRKASVDSDSAGESVSKKQPKQEASKESRKRPKDEKSESVSSTSSGSDSDASESEASPKKRSRTDDQDQKRQKKSKHKKHKKHKRKHKKRKSSRKERDEVRVMSSVVRR